jgi:SAM-dependent methyltransferase
MDDQIDYQAEQERIKNVYQKWHGGAALARYAWHRPEILQQVGTRSRAFAALLSATVGPELSSIRVLDVGCGTGGFLRQLIDWGANPANLAGTELQQDRLDYARLYTAPGVTWHLGTLDNVATASVDLISAQTVFSSILDQAVLRALAAEMWRTLKPGGWCLVFDFRYNNARNRNVRKVTQAELRQLWPAKERRYRSLVLAPPIARGMARAPYLVPELIEALVPPLRTHFMFMARKEG